MIGLYLRRGGVLAHSYSTSVEFSSRLMAQALKEFSERMILMKV